MTSRLEYKKSSTLTADVNKSKKIPKIVQNYLQSTRVTNKKVTFQELTKVLVDKKIKGNETTDEESA